MSLTGRLREAGVRVDDATDDNRRQHPARSSPATAASRTWNDLTLRYLIRKDGLEGEVRVLPVILGDEPDVFLGRPPGRSALAPLLGGALDKLKASGELDRIYARWADLAPDRRRAPFSRLSSEASA